MKKRYLFPIALAAGFVAAFITAGVHSLFFCLLPLLAFAFGYFGSWQRGLLSGFLVFMGYTIATALMWHTDLNVFYPFQYVEAFVEGGFSILVIGALAPLVRRGIRRLGAMAVLAFLAFLMVYFGFLAWPSYSYYHQLILHCTEDVSGLELYLPVGVVDGEVCQELYDTPLDRPDAPLTRDYIVEIVTTEYGEMLKLTIGELMSEGPFGYPYTANIIFELPETSHSQWLWFRIPWGKESAPRQTIELMPRYNVVPIDSVSWGRHIGPLTVEEHRDVAEFEVPIMVSAASAAHFELRLENRTGWGGWINFSYSKSKSYTELVSYEGSFSDDWVLAAVRVTSALNIRGSGD
jgi:hypothetical protein